jgi:hypothetical protein
VSSVEDASGAPWDVASAVTGSACATPDQAASRNQEPNKRPIVRSNRRHIATGSRDRHAAEPDVSDRILRPGVEVVLLPTNTLLPGPW